MEATKDSVQGALAWLNENMVAGGGTHLLPALRRAFDLPRADAFASRTVVVMTDGLVHVEREAFDLVRERLGEGSVFVLGIGDSVNRYLVEGLARVGYGEPFVVASEADGEEVADRLQRYIDSPVLTRLRLTFDGGFEPHELEPPFLPDLFASRPVQVVGKWTGALSGALRLTGFLAGGEAWAYDVQLAALEVARSPAVPLLWARSRIAVLGDYSKALAADNEEAIAALGLEFSLMTAHTSFVAVDSDPAGPELCGAALAPPNRAVTSSATTADQPIQNGASNVYAPADYAYNDYYNSAARQLSVWRSTALCLALLPLSAHRWQ